MRWFILFALAASTLATSGIALAPSRLSSTAQRDVQCFLLYASAAGSSESAANANVLQAALLGTSYFAGKVKVGTPGLNLTDYVREEAEALQANPRIKEIGAGCDAEIDAFSTDMRTVSKELQELAPRSPAS